MNTAAHENLFFYMQKVQQVFSRRLHGDTNANLSKEEYMALYCAGQTVSHNSQCAESTIRNMKSWFQGFMKEVYGGFLTTSSDLKQEDDMHIFLEEYVRVFANFVALRTFLKRVFPHFEKTSFVKLYSLECRCRHDS